MLDPEIKNAIHEAVRKEVNGKLNRIERKIDAHLVDMDPFLSGWRGARALGTFVKWVAGVVAAIGALYWFMKGGF